MSDTMQKVMARVTAPGTAILAADPLDPGKKVITDRGFIYSPELMTRFFEATLEALSSDGQGNPNSCVGGIILSEVSIAWPLQGSTLGKLLANRGIVVGINVTGEILDLPGSSGEKMTGGFDDIERILDIGERNGATFAKRRWAVKINSSKTPSYEFGLAMSSDLARTGEIVHGRNLVAMLEPDIEYIGGNYALQTCADACSYVWKMCSDAYNECGLDRNLILNKTGFVSQGQLSDDLISSSECVDLFHDALLKSGMSDIWTGILSGGQPYETLLTRISMYNQRSFLIPIGTVFSRANQNDAIWVLLKDPEKNYDDAVAVMRHRLKMSGLAHAGKYLIAEDIASHPCIDLVSACVPGST